MKLLFILFLLTPLYCLSQEYILPNINSPGGFSIGVVKGAVISENLIGPRKIIFSGNQLALQRKETENLSTGNNAKASNTDLLTTLYSGRIFSPGILEPYVFNNKTPSELVLIEVMIFPVRLEEPYTLFIDLEVQTSSKPILANQSDDAGVYNAKIIVNLIEI